MLSTQAEASEEHHRASTALTLAQLSTTSFWIPFSFTGKCQQQHLVFRKGKEAVTWLGSASHAKYRTNFWHGTTALWDEEHLAHARQSHQSSECAGSEFKVPSPPLHYTISSVSISAKCQVFPAGCLFLTPQQQLPRHLHIGNPEQQPVFKT